jgi:hypothetical protein
MNPAIIDILKQLVIAIAGISVVGATVATGTIGATNLVSKLTQKEHTIAQVQARGEETPESEVKSKSTGATGVSAIRKTTPSPTSQAKKLGATGALPNMSATVTQSVPGNTGCIITLFGQQYNVTSLQQSHSGGNIFTCGTDMSARYQGEHGSSVSRMQKYLVSSIGTGATGTTGTSSVISTSRDDHDRDIEDSEDEDEKEDKKHEMEKVLEAAKKELEHEDD